MSALPKPVGGFSDAALRGLELFLTKKLIDRLCISIGALLILAIAAFGVLRPAYNWDMVAYVAAAIENRHDNPVDLHRETWAVISEGANEAQMDQLTNANPYNRANYEDPVALQSQLVMFHVKPLYVWTIRALELVVGIGKAAVAASWLPGLFVGFFAIFWLWRADATQAISFVMPVFIMGDYFHMATNVVPDMLHAAVALPALFALSRGRNWLAAGLLVIAVGIRPDSIILTFAILLAAPFFRLRILPILTAFVVGFLTAKFIANSYGHIGWWPHFVFSTVELQTIVTGFDPVFSLKAMVTGYVRGISVAFQHSEWPWLFVILVMARLFALAQGIKGDNRTEALFFACGLGLLGKFASFPLPDDRFYFVFIAGMTVALAAIIKPSFIPSTRSAA